MLVSKESRRIELTAPDLARIANLGDPDQFQFDDGSQSVVAVIERNV